MKRCIQCDFIYENDQSFCDMDGRELVPAPIPVAHPWKPETESRRPAKSRSRRFALPGIAAVLLGTVLLLGYYGFARQNTPPQVTSHSSGKITSPPPAVPETIDQPSPEPTTEAQRAPDIVPDPPAKTTTPSSNQSSKSPSANPRAIHIASPIVKPVPERSASPNPKREEKKPESEKANHKKDSKIGSFFKKTARALKKPFKL